MAEPSARVEQLQKSIYDPRQGYRGYSVSVRLERVSEGHEPYKLGHPQETYRFFSGIADYDREVFVAAHIDGRHNVVSCEEVARGTLTQALVNPREVFKAAILSNAAGIIVAHNHPAGDPAPSAEDRAVDRRLCSVGKLIGIPVLDFLVIGSGGRYWSRSMHG